jgi:hypothetical protein
MAKRLLANRPARVWELVGLVGLGSGGFIAVNLSKRLARVRQTRGRKHASPAVVGHVGSGAVHTRQRTERMRSWTIAAALLLGLAAQAGMAVASDAAGQRGPQPEKPTAGSAPASGATRTSSSTSTTPSRSDSPSRADSASTSPSHAASGETEPEADGADRADGTDSADGRRPPRTERSSPAASPAAAAPPPAVFIISCNASGCNDNQGRFLTRSGPQRLVGPNGLSCQLMGGNWQCSPGTPP